MNCQPFGVLWHHIKACWSYIKVFLAPGGLESLQRRPVSRSRKTEVTTLLTCCSRRRLLSAGGVLSSPSRYVAICSVGRWACNLKLPLYAPPRCYWNSNIYFTGVPLELVITVNFPTSVFTIFVTTITRVGSSNECRGPHPRCVLGF